MGNGGVSKTVDALPLLHVLNAHTHSHAYECTFAQTQNYKLLHTHLSCSRDMNRDHYTGRDNSS